MLEFTIIYDISRFVRNWELIMQLDREIEKCTWIMKLRNVKKVQERTHRRFIVFDRAEVPIWFP